MYCEKCGNQVLDTDKFCENCGNNLMDEIQKETICNINKDEVLLEIRPTTKFSYFILPTLLKDLMGILFMVIIWVALFSPLLFSTNDDPRFAQTGIMIMLGIAGGIILIQTLLLLLGAILTKKENQNKIYTFYPDRVVYRDTFLDKSQEEMKYKYVREVASKQTITQRIFKVGTIRLSSNAEGLSTGLLINDIEEIEENYKRIKEIINV